MGRGRIELQAVCFVVLTLALLPALSISALAAGPQGNQDPAASVQGASVPASTASGQTSGAAASSSAQPLPNPPMTGPLQTAAPYLFDAGPLGQLAVGGVLSGMGLAQGNWVSGDKSTQWDLSNGQVFLQKTTGWWQFYLQAGVYNFPVVGTPFLSTGDTVNDLYGPLPVGYLKLVKGNFSVEVGALPTLIGAEYDFDFQNMNIERGLLWNQEPAISRGVQIDESFGRLSASLSWNDGFYSSRYTWLSGSLSYALNSSSTLAFTAGGNLGQTAYTTAATPIQNNSAIYDVIYSYSHQRWMFQSYFQYTNVPTNAGIGINRGASTRGGAALVNYKFRHGISLSGRAEYITTTGSAADGAVNLLYGPGSGAWTFTLTPTYQNHGLFVRGDFSVVHAVDATPGDAFGRAGRKDTQPRGVIEAGILF